MNEVDLIHSKNSLRAWIQLIKTAKRIESRLNSHFVSEHGSSMSRFDVLANLARCPEYTASTSQLSGMLLASKGNITRLLDRMVADGLIKREMNAEDKRVSEVRMTSAGETLFQSLVTDHESWIDNLFTTLSNTELNHLIGVMEKLRDRMDETR